MDLSFCYLCFHEPYYRAYAALCEERARAETSPSGRREWERAARDWHLLAEAAADGGWHGSFPSACLALTQ